MRSFRAVIARRTALAVGALLAAVLVVSIYVLGRLLQKDLDATLLRIAEVEAEAGYATTGTQFQFHEGVLLARGDPALPELTRYAQLLAGDGTVLLRSRNLTLDLPVPLDALAEVRFGGLVWATHDGNDGQRLRTLLYPLLLLGAEHGDHVLMVSAPYRPVAETLRVFAFFLGALTLGGTIVAFVMGWRGAGMALRPTRDIALQAQSLEIGSLSARITAHQDVDEFRELVDVLNAMLERLDRAFESQRRFTADASHELRAPLNVLRGELEVALKRPRDVAEYREVLERCLDEVLRLSRLADDLLTLARADAGASLRRAPLDLYEIAESVVARYHALASERRIDLSLSGRSVWLVGSGELLERAVVNLVDNAIKHTGPGGSVTVMVEPGDPVTLTVRDSGTGVRPEHVPHLFERFFQSDPARSRTEGTGLGLSIVRAAAELHGGSASFDGNDPGAVFRLRIPTGPNVRHPVVSAGAAE